MENMLHVCGHEDTRKVVLKANKNEISLLFSCLNLSTVGIEEDPEKLDNFVMGLSRWWAEQNRRNRNGENIKVWCRIVNDKGKTLLKRRFKFYVPPDDAVLTRNAGLSRCLHLWVDFDQNETKIQDGEKEIDAFVVQQKCCRCGAVKKMVFSSDKNVVSVEISKPENSFGCRIGYRGMRCSRG